jgi:arginine utilization regulatory protein
VRGKADPGLWEALLEYGLDTVADGIHVVDAQGHTVLYNSATARMEGLRPEEVVGKHLLEVFPSLNDETSTLLTVLRTGKPILERQQTYASFKGRKITTVNSSVPLTFKGRVVGAMEIVRDITRVVEMSERIVDLQSRLAPRGPGRERSPGSWATYSLEDIVTVNPAMKRLKSVTLRAARSDAPVIVYGETGTGKELFAHSLHNSGPRMGAPFVAQNCSAIPATLLESILFGTVKGSFTGAQDRRGLFELADGGTLFLDEINSMPLDLQPKILRVLQDGNVRRVGDLDVRPVNVRVIASTNLDPMEAVRKKSLREDLYYRIAVISLRIPPLRERRDDIPSLAGHFVAKYNKSHEFQVRGVRPGVLDLFQRYPWPGNVRELEHAIEGAMSIMDGEFIEIHDLPPPLLVFSMKPAGAMDNPKKPLHESLRELERGILQETLRRCQGNISRAARALGVPRQTLQSKIKRLGM